MLVWVLCTAILEFLCHCAGLSVCLSVCLCVSAGVAYVRTLYWWLVCCLLHICTSLHGHCSVMPSYCSGATCEMNTGTIHSVHSCACLSAPTTGHALRTRVCTEQQDSIGSYCPLELTWMDCSPMPLMWVCMYLCRPYSIAHQCLAV